MNFLDLARVTTPTTGTATTLALGSAVTGFLDFAGAGAIDGKTYRYGILDGSGSELCSGVYSASGGTITRTTLKSTNSGSPISLSGKAQIFGTAAAEDLVPGGTIFGDMAAQNASAVAITGGTIAGAVTGATQTLGDNSTKLSTTAFVASAIAALVASSPATLDTLKELADALGDDPNFATTTATALGNRVRFDASQSLTGGQVTQAWSNLGIAFANPSASVGLSAVNGSAATYMRSDAAPALSQSISPTWTGAHTFGSDNVAVTLARTVNTAEKGILWKTGGTSNWFIGQEASADSHFHIYNYGLGVDVLTIDYTTAKFTFAVDATIHGLTIGRGGSSITDNVAVGTNALSANTTGGQSTAVGHVALAQQTTGALNTAVGYAALNALTTGVDNTAVGYIAMAAGNVTGNYNNAFGSNAMNALTSGAQNNAFGLSALASLTTGTNNTAYGHQALATVTTNGGNVGIGYQALLATTGGFNTAAGTSAGVNVTSGANNSFFGINSGGGITTGNNNTILGANVGSLAAGLSDNIILATGAGAIKAQYNSSLWTLTDNLTTTGGTLTVSPASANAVVKAAAPSGSQAQIMAYDAATGHVGIYLFSANGYSGIATTDNAGAYTGDPIHFTASSLLLNGANLKQSSVSTTPYTTDLFGVGSADTRSANAFSSSHNIAANHLNSTVHIEWTGTGNTGFGAPQGSCIALSVAGMKANPTSTTIKGETIATWINAYGGIQGEVAYTGDGDVAAINSDVRCYGTWGIAEWMEATVSYYDTSSIRQLGLRLTQGIIGNQSQSSLGGVHAIGYNASAEVGTGLGYAYFAQNNGGSWSYFAATSGGSTLSMAFSTSDPKTKKLVRKLPSARALLMGIDAVGFFWQDFYKHHAAPCHEDNEHYGFLSYDGHGLHGVRDAFERLGFDASACTTVATKEYGDITSLEPRQMIAWNWKATQENYEDIEALKGDNEAMKDQIAALQIEIAALSGGASVH